MENTFKKGLILGGLLAAASAVGFAFSKEGQELSGELQKDLNTLVKQVKKNLNKLQDVTEDSFDGLVVSVVDEYAKKKELASATAASLTWALQSKWHEMEAEYLADKE